MQISLRDQFQRAYQQKVTQLRGFYQMKHESLKQTLRTSYYKVIESQLLHTMFQDETTQEYAKGKIDELFMQTIRDERELVIEQLGMKLSDLKGEIVLRDGIIAKLNQQITSISSQLMSKQEQLTIQRNNYQNRSIKFTSQQQSVKEQFQKSIFDKDAEIRELKQELRRFTSELTGIKINLAEKEFKLQSLQKSERQLVQNNKQYSNLIRKMESQQIISNQKQSQQNELRTGAVRILQSKIQEIQRNSLEIQQTMRAQMEKKSLAYKKKLEQYKHKVSELLSKNTILQKKLQMSLRTITDLQNSLSASLQQNDRSLSEYRYQRDKERLQLQKKFQYQLKEFQSHYQRLLQSKIGDVQQQAMHHLNAMKECEREYQEVMEQKAIEYDNNYVQRREYERMIKEKQDIIDLQLMNIHEKELDAKQMEFRITIAEDKKHQTQKQVSHLSAKLADYELVLKQEKMRRKNIQSQTDSLKAQNKKYRKLITQYEEKLKSISQEIQEKMTKAEKIKQKFESVSEELKAIQFNKTDYQNKIKLYENNLKDEECKSKQLRGRVQKLLDEIAIHQSQKSQIQQKLIMVNKLIENLSEQSKSMSLETKDQKQSLLTFKQQNSRLKQQIEVMKKIQQQQAESLKISICDMTQKYTDFKSIACKLQLDLKSKDQFISELQSSSDLVMKKKRKLQQNYLRLLKQVGQLSKCIQTFKEAFSNSNKIYIKEIQLLAATANLNLQDMIRLKEAYLQQEKLKIKHFCRAQIQTIMKRMKQQRTTLIKSFEQQSQTMKKEIGSLYTTISQLKSQSLLLKTEVSNSKSAHNTQGLNSANQILNLQSQLQILEKQYSVLKGSYRCLADQNSKLQTQFNQKSQILEEKQELLKRLTSQVQSFEKQLSQTLQQNDILKQRKNRLQAQINEMKMIVNRAAKHSDSDAIKRAKILDMETRQLTQKVQMLKKMGVSFSATKEMLRG